MSCPTVGEGHIELLLVTGWFFATRVDGECGVHGPFPSQFVCEDLATAWPSIALVRRGVFLGRFFYCWEQ